MSRDDAFEAWRRRALDADILEVALGGIVNAQLRKKSREHVGPCPMCGGGSQEKGKRRPADGFSVNPGKGVFNCRRGGVGGDVIAMVMHTNGVPFSAACELITGEPPPARGSAVTEETKKKSEELKAEAAERERRRIEDDNIYRAREIRTVREIYDRAHPFAGSSAEIYAGIRGLRFPPAPADRAAPIKCVEGMPYHVDKDTIVHRGPAMVAPIINASREFQGLHFTYLDLAREKGKLQLEYKGEPVDAKKSRGSKQGNFVALCGPPAPEFLVIGEAIEKTIAVYMALAASGRDLSAAAFWSACDLGNLAGKAAGSVAHPVLKSEKTGRPIKVAGGAPDLTEPAIDIPDSVTDLVLLGDSTSDPFTTRLAMARAATRYARPGRTVRIAWAPEGVDFDDLLREVREDQAATAAALERIAGIVDSAPDFVEAVPPVEEDAATRAEAIRKFGLAELDAAIALVRASGGEARGAVLSGAAQRLGQLVGAGAVHEGFAKAALEEAASACGLIRDDGLKAVKAAIAAGVKLGKKQPRDLSEVRGDALAALRAPHSERRPREAADHVSSPSSVDDVFPPDASSPFFAADPAPPAEEGESATSSQKGTSSPKAAAAGGEGGREPPEDEGDLDLRLSRFPLTDLGNAERFHARYRQKLLFCGPLGWLMWDGKRYASKGANELVKIAAHLTVRGIQREAKALAASGEDWVFNPKKGTMYSEEIAKFGRASESRQRIAALPEEGAPYFAAAIDDLDEDPWKINVLNGTLTIDRKNPDKIVSFGPHDPFDLITKVCNVEYHPEAVCPLYDKFMSDVQPEPAMRRFLHQWVGLSFTADVSEQKLFFLYGKGRNGKSTAVDIWSHIAGDYGETVPIETFLDAGRARSGGQATPDLALLPGVRLLRTSEPEKGARLAEALVKLVTGGEPMQARDLNRSFFRFYPKFKLTISGNYRLTISGADEGIWRRYRNVPFAVQIAKEDIDAHLGDKLRLETPGIFNRILDGLRDWCDNGLVEPETVTKATAAQRADSDPLGRFLAVCVEACPGGRVQSSVIYQLFVAWCKSAGDKEWSNKGFSLAMKERGYVSAQSNVMWWHDIKLIKSVGDFVDHDGKPRVMKDENEATDHPTEEKDASDIEF